MAAVITVENLSKRYVIDHRVQQPDSLREAITSAVRSGWGALHRLASRAPGAVEASQEEFWALRDVSFEVEKGARVGIIGRNGAGKSTLLKILSRITEPTTGRVCIDGRVVSLLEVGTGFHPELTGRENVFLNGAILGMSRTEISSKFDEIVAFAEIEKFIDTPVKRYSSGMYVRLAFAVAAHLEPEILIVDEVLAVGDMNFQRKCLGKMEDVSKSGRTVLFVSHNLTTVSALCNKAILIKQGCLSSVGDAADVIATYLEEQTSTARSHRYKRSESELSVDDSKADLIEIMVCDSMGRPRPNIFLNDDFAIDVVWQLNIDVPFLRLGVEIIDRLGNIVISTMDTDTNGLNGVPRKRGVFHEQVAIPGFLLMPGVYTVNVFAGVPRIGRLMEVNSVIRFEITENNTHLSHLTGVERDGYISTPLLWKTESESF